METQQLLKWRKVRELLKQGRPIRQISRLTGVCGRTIRIYRDKGDEPPRAIGKPLKARPGVERYREFAVPDDIADLRDRLVAAFLRGDLTEWSKLSQQLKDKMGIKQGDDE